MKAKITYFVTIGTINRTKKEDELPHGTSPPCKLKTTNKRNNN